MAITQGNTGSGGGVSSSVTVTSLPSTPAGSSTIGKVDQGVGGVSAWKVDGSGVIQPVSGTVAVSSLPALPAGANAIGTVTANAGTGTFAVSAAALPLPVGASTETTLALIKAKTDNLDVLLSTRTKPADSQTVTGTVTANAGTGTFNIQATAAAPGSVELSDGTAFYTAAKTGQLPAALVGTRLDVNVGKVPGTVSTLNSTAVNLSNAAVFTGISEDVSGYASVSVNVFADQSSAAGGLSLQWSSNGTNWDILNAYTVTLNVGQTILLPPRAQFFRIVYTNGAVTQTAFRLQTVFHPVAVHGDVGGAAQQVQGALAAGVLSSQVLANGAIYSLQEASPYGAR